jgi:hypothetical protein
MDGLPAMPSQQKWPLEDFRRVSLHAKAILHEVRITLVSLFKKTVDKKVTSGSATIQVRSEYKTD